MRVTKEPRSRRGSFFFAGQALVNGHFIMSAPRLRN